MKKHLLVAALLVALSLPASGQSVVELLPSEPLANGAFGSAVDIDGDVAAVGMRGTGSVYIYRFNGSDWVEEQRLTKTVAGGGFGAAVAVSGDLLVVGAIGSSSSTRGHSIFYRFVQGEWIEEASFSKSGGQLIVRYAESVDIDGTTAVVSDPVVNDSLNTGAVYVYEYDGSTWDEVTTLRPEDGLIGGSFGFSISLDGDALLVGRPFEDLNASTPSVGSSFVYRKLVGDFELEQKLISTTRDENDFFGRSVAFSGNTAAVYSGGTVEVHTFDGTTWDYQQSITDPTVKTVGFPIALAGGTIIVKDGTEVGVHTFDGISWSDVGKLSPNHGESTDAFGNKLSFDGTRAIVAAPNHTHDNVKTGAAYVFESVTSVSTNRDEQYGSGSLVVHGAFPNPFSSESTISFSIDRAGFVRIEVFDLAGRIVARLLDSRVAAGQHEVTWLTGSSPAGLYIVRVNSYEGSVNTLLAKVK